MAKIKIWSDGGTRQGVELDGEDISNAVKSIDFTMDAARPADINLHLAVFEMEIDADESTVHIADATRDLLIWAGWRPPKDGRL